MQTFSGPAEKKENSKKTLKARRHKKRNKQRCAQISKRNGRCGSSALGFVGLGGLGGLGGLFSLPKWMFPGPDDRFSFKPSIICSLPDKIDIKRSLAISQMYISLAWVGLLERNVVQPR